MQFWPEIATDASWNKLQQIRKEFDFTLIGGWAVFLWTHQHKSKDIDVVVSMEVLHQLKKTYSLQKNDRLKKYEIKQDLFDIDVYVEHFSNLTLPPETIRKNARNVEGFQVASPETLLIMKQGAYQARHASLKGRKDAIDLLALLLYAPIDWKEYRRLVEENGCDQLAYQLKTLVLTFDPDDLKYVGSQNVHSFKKWKSGFLKIVQNLEITGGKTE